INVTRLRVLSADELEEVDIAAFLPASARPAQDMLNELEALCRTELTYQPWRTFALGVLQDPDIRPRLLTAPAAKAVHHAWVGGLLEHTLAVATLCLRFCDQYPDLDRQTLFVGALCHDLGKLWELSGGLANDYTDAGRLIGHINLCMEKLEPHILAAGLSPELALHLQHLVLSHHGQYEYGSPRLPQTAEAFALHYADNLDAKLTQNRTLFADLDAGETGWSPYQKTLERALYQAPRTPVTPATDASSAAVDVSSASVAQVLPVRPRRAKKSHTSQTSEPTPPTESTTCDSECHPEGDERPQPRTKQCSLL
ncbi:MAG: HD domain-containing protein, partial [Bilophila sp.]